MTRKKYIKALMALDVSRNGANAMALAAQVLGTSYEEDYRQRAPWLRLALFSRRALRNVTAAVMRLAESITNATAALPVFKLDPADFEPEPPHDWPKENPHLAGLRADLFLVDELDSLPSDKLHDQAMGACAGGGGND